MINQTVGDAFSGILAVEAALRCVRVVCMCVCVRMRVRTRKEGWQRANVGFLSHCLNSLTCLDKPITGVVGVLNVLSRRG